MTYSEVVALLSSHLVPRELEGQQMIPLLEKFVNLDSIEEDFSRAPPLLDQEMSQ
jgi:hypothetical protein